ncbi:MAG: DNA-processing protein DprA, partial [Abditibacteriales bacterium]|nr:DNA-processing protein DprA [Abditibacteriales bacterium]MDW8365771.1 DNA-processing protein DprA [Abditibacteriales bacterium]
MSKAHWLALSTLPNVGSVTVRRLIERFGSVEAIFDAPDEDLLRVPRFTADVVARLRAVSLVALEEELAAMADEGLSVLTWDDEDYPVNLRRVPDAPPLLFVRGRLLPEDERAVAIVGTRQPSPRAVAVAET